MIAVTGSNGKTTTKEMVAAILKVEFGEAVLATRGNFNNDIGLPLTLLGMDASRITSYNVCYTKLLRMLLAALARPFPTPYKSL